MLTEKNLIKALSLAIAEKICPVTADGFISAINATGIVQITDAADVFEEFIENGLLLEKEENGKKQYALSETGKIILPEFLPLLNAGISSDAINAAVRFHEETFGGNGYSSAVKKENDKYVLTCTHTNGKESLCVASLYFDNEAEALMARNNFEKRPAAVINAIKAAITGNVDFMI